jgi:hypothetical protein
MRHKEKLCLLPLYKSFANARPRRKNAFSTVRLSCSFSFPVCSSGLVWFRNSRPPLHAPVALDNIFNFLLRDALVFWSVRVLLAKLQILVFVSFTARGDEYHILEPNHALKSGPVQRQIGVSQQLFLHERAQRSSVFFNASVFL